MSKARKIVVEEQEFAWSIGKTMYQGDNIPEVRIWKDKQIVLRKGITEENEITPSLVKKIIMRNDLTTL